MFLLSIHRRFLPVAANRFVSGATPERDRKTAPAPRLSPIVRFAAVMGPREHTFRPHRKASFLQSLREIMQQMMYSTGKITPAGVRPPVPEGVHG
jgi:hypothetical protein